jgi:hypothetical protein
MGGRPVTTGTEAHRAEMRRYRARLKATATPEIDDVDRALVQSLLGAIGQASAARAPMPEGLRSVIAGAKTHLLGAGFSQQAVIVRLKRRLKSVARRSRSSESVAPITTPKNNGGTDD